MISYSREALEEAHEDIIKFAKAEHLTAHANSIAVRFGKEVFDQNYYLTCTSEVCYIFNVVNKVDGPLMEIYH